MKRSNSKTICLNAARSYLLEHAPALRDACYTVQALDGPPDAPRTAVTAERCVVEQCPYGVTPQQVALGRCPIRTCPLRCTVRFLFDRDAHLVQITTSNLHWAGQPRRVT